MSFLLLIFLLISTAWSQVNLSFGDLAPSKLDIFKKVKSHLLLTHDYMANTGGEDSKPKNIGAYELLVRNKFPQGRAFFHYGHLERFGNERVIGDTQMASNIDVTTQADRIINLWYDHSWSKKFSTLIGIHDLSSEFNVTHGSLNFLNSSFGTGAEISYSGNNGPSVYPFTSLAARFYKRFEKNFTYRGAVYDGDPGSRGTYHSFHSDVGGKGGYFIIQEGVHRVKSTKNALGVWNHTTINSKGVYYLFETDPTDATMVFFRYGWSDPTKSFIKSNAAFGGVYRGIFQKKKFLDEAGIGLTQVQFSNDDLRPEISYETYYQFELMKGILLRPDTQFITSPSGNSNIKSAWVYALRTVIQI